MAVLAVLMSSCVATSATRTATQIPEASPTAEPTLEPIKKIKFSSADIDTLMNKIIGQIPLAGISLGIRYKDLVYEQGYGLADIASSTPVTTQTKFKIASLTKSFTAAAILRLRDDGKLNLEDPISGYLPNAPEFAQGVQVRHLLNHTSGLPDWSIDDAQAALPEAFTTDQAVEYYFNTFQSLDSEPGQSYSYNNAGYFLLGAIIEKVTGMRYDEYMKVNFFEPLGLEFIGECNKDMDSLATGYHLENRHLVPASPSNLKLGAAASALCSSAGDLLKWHTALSNGKVIEPGTWQQMITPLPLSGGQSQEYGFGFVIQKSDQGLKIYHDGATAGFNSYMVYYPERDAGIVLLVNTDGFEPPLDSIASLLIAKILRTL
jgi:CubicO group peptidase (beta-lactamase class C family)